MRVSLYAFSLSPITDRRLSSSANKNDSLVQSDTRKNGSIDSAQN